MRNTYFTDIPRNVILSAERKKTPRPKVKTKTNLEDNKMSEKVFLIVCVVFSCVAVLGSCFFNMNFMVGLVLCVIPGIMGFMLKKASE